MSKKMEVEYLILWLRIEEGNNLSKKRSNSFTMTPKANIVEQASKNHNKN
jgi:hypothetical protein